MTSLYGLTNKGNGQYELNPVTTQQQKSDETVAYRTYTGTSTAFKVLGGLVFSTLIESAMASSGYGCYKYEIYDCDDIEIVDNKFSLDGCRLKCDNWGDCFSSKMTLNIKGHGEVSMDKLKPGMIVELSSGDHFTITDLPHRDPHKTIEYLKIGFDGGFLEISPEHHLVLKNKESDQEETFFAKKVVSHSDQYQIQYKGKWVDIDSVEWTEEEGVFTVEGLNVHELEVNGVRVGAYSKTNSPLLARLAMLPRQIYHSCIAMPKIDEDTVRKEGTFEKKIIDGVSSVVPFLFG